MDADDIHKFVDAFVVGAVAMAALAITRHLDPHREAMVFYADSEPWKARAMEVCAMLLSLAAAMNARFVAWNGAKAAATWAWRRVVDCRATGKCGRR
jgi:hypothetical protein